MILNCWIIDDEPLALSLLESYIENTPFLKLTGKYTNAGLAMQDILTRKVDLIFLDIQMPRINGMEFAHCVPSETKIIFITAFKEYALEGYRVSALDYLLKPVSYDDFLATSQKALNWFQAIADDTEEGKETPETDSIFVKSDYQLIRVLLKDILYIEGLKDYIKIYTRNDRKPIITLASMKSMEEALPGSLFIRIHRSFIVQKNKIGTVNKNRLTVGNREIPIGRTYKKTVFDFIGKKY